MITVTDLFAGAGGSSTGARMAGLDVVAAANHWNTAIATHTLNHPGTLHECINISQCDPGRFPTTDVAWLSPSCTHHSRARGRRANAGIAPVVETAPDLPTLRAAEPDMSRATMFDAIRFADHHHYRYIVVENVPEIRDWALYPHWLDMMSTLGYQHRVQILDASRVAQHGPAVPQSRIRYFATFWREDQPAPPPVQTSHPTTVAAQVLDADPGRLLDDRPRPITPAIRAKLEATLDAYPDAQRLIFPYYGATRIGYPADARPLGTLTTHARHGVLTRTRRGVCYRMLNNREEAAAMGFPTSYRFAGTKADITKQTGNAVCTNVARDLLTNIAEAVAAL